MKGIKKIISGCLAAVMLSSTGITAGAAVQPLSNGLLKASWDANFAGSTLKNSSSSNLDLQPEEKVYSNATLEDEFISDSVIVILNRQNSVLNKKYSTGDFGHPEIVAVEDLTAFDLSEPHMEGYEQQVDFHQILMLHLKTKTKSNVLKVITELEKRSDVLSVEPNYLYEAYNDAPVNDPFWSYNRAEFTSTNIIGAWSEFSPNAEEVKVGVIDSGISKHEDLDDNVIEGFDFVSNNAITDDDLTQHGTMVSGIIGAVGNNGIGVAGVVHKVQLVPLQVADGAYFFSSVAISKSIQYATQHDIPILNCSFGSKNDYTGGGLGQNPYDPPAIGTKAAIENYPGLVVCAAGNKGTDNDAFPDYPSSYDCDNIISVAASNYRDELSYSNYGQTTVDLVAPEGSYTTKNQEDYTFFGGTSSAAPYVSGTAALIKANYPELTTAQIKKCILEGVDKIDELEDKCVTGGRVNVYKALKYAENLERTVSGDFNGDGIDEAVTLRDNGTSVTLSMNQLNGTKSVQWKHVDNYDAGKIRGVATGDFDRNGNDDIAILYEIAEKRYEFHVISSTGSSFLDLEVWYDTGSSILGDVEGLFMAGDTNGNGHDEIIIMQSNYPTSYTSNYTCAVTVYKPNGNTFVQDVHWTNSQFPSNYSADWLEGRVALADINQDGTEDIVMVEKGCSSTTGTPELYITALYSYGGFFSTRQVLDSYSTYSFPLDLIEDNMVIGDYNGDGLNDIIFMYENYGPKVTVLEGRSSSTTFRDCYNVLFQTQDSYNVLNMKSLIAGDFNGNGKTDLYARYKENRQNPVYDFFTSTGNGSQWSGSGYY